MVDLYAGAVTRASGDGLDRSTVAPIDGVNKAGGLIDRRGMRGCRSERDSFLAIEILPSGGQGGIGHGGGALSGSIRGAVMVDGHGDGIRSFLGILMAAVDREHAIAVGDRAGRGCAIAPGDGGAVV